MKKRQTSVSYYAKMRRESDRKLDYERSREYEKDIKRRERERAEQKRMRERESERLNEYYTEREMVESEVVRIGHSIDSDRQRRFQQEKRTEERQRERERTEQKRMRERESERLNEYFAEQLVIQSIKTSEEDLNKTIRNTKNKDRENAIR